MFKIIIITISFCLSSISSSVFAHHSFAAEYDIDQPITLSGKVTKMDFVNPHAWIYIEIEGEGGEPEEWAVEMIGASLLMRTGLRKNDFPEGVEVVVEAYRARSGHKVANTSNIRFKDGSDYIFGNGKAL